MNGIPPLQGGPYLIEDLREAHWPDALLESPMTVGIHRHLCVLDKLQVFGWRWDPNINVLEF